MKENFRNWTHNETNLYIDQKYQTWKTDPGIKHLKHSKIGDKSKNYNRGRRNDKGYRNYFQQIIEEKFPKLR